MRNDGESLKVIAKALNVSKASVSGWVRGVVLTKERQKELFLRGWTRESIEKRRSARIYNEEQKRSLIIEEAKHDIKKVSPDALKIIGAMLYWAEGGKTKRMVRFANSDPQMVKVIMHFFRFTCGVKEEKFRAHIHTYSHLNSGKAEKYWSDITGIPRQQFYKTYVKPSIASKGKRDSLPYGTLDIYVCDTKLFLAIMGWISKIKDLILNMK